LNSFTIGVPVSSGTAGSLTGAMYAGFAYVNFNPTAGSATRLSTSSSGQYVLFTLYANSFNDKCCLWVSKNYGNSFQGVTLVSLGAGSTTITNTDMSYTSMSANGKYQYTMSQNQTTRFYSSTDYGLTWSQTNPTTGGFTGTNRSDMTCSASGQYIAVAGNNGGGIGLSTDYGQNWKRCGGSTAGFTGPGSNIVYMSSSAQTIMFHYVGTVGSYNQIYVSQNYGGFFVKKYSQSSYSTYGKGDMSASGQYVIFPNSDATGYPLFTNDYGETWRTLSTNGIPVGISNLFACMTKSGQYIYYPNSKLNSALGIYISTNYGESFMYYSLQGLFTFMYEIFSVIVSSNGDYFYILSNSGNITTLRASTFSTNTSIIRVGNYSSSSGVTGIRGSLYYDTTIGGASGLRLSDGINWNGVKSFIIDHPTNTNKYLVHGCLEGPEAGIYYRGIGEITNNESTQIELPDYVEKIASNITIQVTGIYDNSFIKKYNPSEIRENTFYVYGPNGKFYWIIYGTREILDVEPFKTNKIINGDGPYKYI
jgi:hypothetical protein